MECGRACGPNKHLCGQRNWSVHAKEEEVPTGQSGHRASASGGVTGLWFSREEGVAYVAPTPRPKMGAPEAGYKEVVRHVSHVSGDR